MRLLTPVRFTDPNGVEWVAPAGAIVDGASIPQFAWSFIGGPFEGRYRDASVIHDVACDEKRRPWQSVHRVFFNAMMAQGVSPAKAKTMYAAVFYFGPRWSDQNGVVPPPTTMTKEAFYTLAAIIEVREKGRVSRENKHQLDLEGLVASADNKGGGSPINIDELKRRGPMSLNDIDTYNPITHESGQH